MPTQICAECGTKYRVPDSAVGKKAKCKKCGAIMVITGDQEEEIFQFADAIDAPPTPPAAPVEADPRAAITPDTAGPTGSYQAYEAPTAGGVQKFAQSVVETFLFPVTLGNLITFIILWVFLVLGNISLAAGGFFIIPWLIVVGWYLGYLFSVIESGAAGEEELPTLTLTEGFVDSVVVPMLKMLGSWAVAFIPAADYIVMTRGFWELDLLWTGSLTAIAQEDATLAGLRVLGDVLWPMVVLCVGLGGFTSLLRIDLILLTIIKTLPVYLLVVGLVLGTEFLEGVLLSRISNVYWGVISIGVPVYLEIVAVRVIGLYYHHFKHRFAWDWG